MQAFDDDLARLWFLVRRIAGLLDRTGEALFQETLGISLPQFLVLSVVDAHPGSLNQQVLADRLGLTKGTVSRQLDSAVSAGLLTVAVSEHSRREHSVALTPKGTSLVRRGDAVFAEARDSWLPPITARDFAATLRVLSAVNDGLERQPGA